MEKITKDELNFMVIIPIIMEENPEYLFETIYELETEYGNSQISGYENLFEDVSPQYMCLKIVHNLSMMGNFVKNFLIQSGATMNSTSSKNKSLYLKLSIKPENIDILKKKGFGLFSYNVDDMAYSLYEFQNAIKNLLEEKSKEKDYDFLNIILKDFINYTLTDPNTAMYDLINNNKDFYKNEIKKAETIIKENG